MLESVVYNQKTTTVFPSAMTKSEDTASPIIQSYNGLVNYLESQLNNEEIAMITLGMDGFTIFPLALLTILATSPRLRFRIIFVVETRWVERRAMNISGWKKAAYEDESGTGIL